MARSERTKRADLLLRALDCINANDYDDRRDYIIFGKGLDEIMDEAGIPEREIRDNPDRTPMRELASDLKTQSGREHATRRTSLAKARQPKKFRGLDNLSGEGLRSLMEYARRPQRHEVPGAQESRTLDELDAHYARELLAKLPKIVGRASRLEALDLSAKVPDEVRGYFAEAHRCYLYGFPIACAVLCRAILASALEREIDPTGRIKKKLPLKESYFERLVKEAEGRNILTDDRPGWALKVRDAGNEAIHGLGKFMEHWDGKLEEILLNTRKVLIDLFERKG
jgi:hypothetical protein